MSQLEVAPPKEGTTDIRCAASHVQLLQCLRPSALSIFASDCECPPIARHHCSAPHRKCRCRRGHIASIHPERDFYIALAPHADWSNAHTAWGFIEDLSAVEAVVAHAFTEMKHAVHGTVMRMLVEPVPFTVELAADDEAPARRA